jgi:hypothetical protein
MPRRLAAAGRSCYLMEVRNRSRDRFDNRGPRWGKGDACTRRFSFLLSLFIELRDFLREDLGRRILLAAATLEANQGEEAIRLAVLGFAVGDAGKPPDRLQSAALGSAS